MVYVPHWDFPDEATKEAFSDAVGHAVAEAVAKEAFDKEAFDKEKQSRGTGKNLAENFGPQILIGGCVTALELPDELQKRLGRCLLMSFPINGRDPRKLGVLPELPDAWITPRGLTTYKPQYSGCILLDVSEKRVDRGLGRTLKKAWNKAVKPVVKKAAKAAVAEVIGHIPGASALKSIVSRGPALRELDLGETTTRRTIQLENDIPVTIHNPVTLVW
jgi:hypothetical protein